MWLKLCTTCNINIITMCWCVFSDFLSELQAKQNHVIWMKHCLTQRLGQCGFSVAVENIMNLVLQVHNSCKRPVTAPTASLLVWRSTFVARCSEPHRQRPVQSDIQHIKPERPVGLTPEPCDPVCFLLRARGWRYGRRWGREGNSLHVWLLFGLWFVELRFNFPTAGTVLTKWAVAVQKVATAQWGCGFYGRGVRFLVQAAVSEIRLQHVSSLSRGGEGAAYRGAGQERSRQAEAHLTHTGAGLWDEDWLAALRVGGGTFVRAGVVFVVTGMITHSDVCNLKDKRWDVVKFWELCWHNWNTLQLEDVAFKHW